MHAASALGTGEAKKRGLDTHVRMACASTLDFPLGIGERIGRVLLNRKLLVVDQAIAEGRSAVGRRRSAMFFDNLK